MMNILNVIHRYIDNAPQATGHNITQRNSRPFHDLKFRHSYRLKIDISGSGCRFDSPPTVSSLQLVARKEL